MSSHTRETISGAVTLLGGFISADVVLPARYSFLGPREMAEHVLEELSPDVNAAVRSRPLIVAGEAFGYGTGRESPARALRAAGVRAIIGGPFGRMFFRNAVNNGVFILDCPEILSSGIVDGDGLAADVLAGTVRWKDRDFSTLPIPKVIRDIVAAGGLIDYGRSILGAARTEARA
jgi:3-isopropylmalate/(R)-2-methylmalate dehydratase small subunit